MRNITNRLTICTFLACSAISIASADNLALRDGQNIRGTFLGGTPRQVKFEVNGEVRTYDVGLVRSLTFTEPANNPPPRETTYSAPPPPPERQMPERQMPERQVPERQVNDGYTIPADTLITVRMVDSVNSETSRLGQTFMASLDEPIVVNGNVLVPRGADITTKLVDDRQAGKLQGRTVQTLTLVSMKVQGRWVELSSADVRTESGSQGAKSGKIVGGTAALGAIIGGIAGGGKGAAIGAASGGAVGVGAAVITSGEKVVIPSETRLTFRLQSPAQL